MQTKENLIPVEGDVNHYLKKKQFMLDNDIERLFKEFNIRKLLHKCKIKKRCGQSTDRLVFDLVFVPFLMLTNVFLFVQSQFENAARNKNQYYRLLENARYNWRSFILNIACHVTQAMHKSIPDRELNTFFIVDDTITKVSGKLVEAASYVYDHVAGKSVLGFQKLVLGQFDGSHFIPLSNHICTGKRKPNAKSKAKKYQKIPKSGRIPADCAGAVERKQLDKTKLEKAVSMLKQAQRKGFSATTVLFDSWFCFNSFIIQIVTALKLNVICQLKNLPRPNKYLYRGKAYSLAELYAYFARPRLRTVKKLHLKRSVISVQLAGSEVKMKIVFILGDGKEKWHAFGATDTSLAAEKILEYYSYRWSIEVFFKCSKQYLNLGKEQMSNLDSIIACDALVFLRYILLTYLASVEEKTFYETFDDIRKVHLENTFGMRLLKYFLGKLSSLIQQAIILIKNGLYEHAQQILIEIMENNCEIGELKVD